MDEVRIIEIKQSIFEDNDKDAERLRSSLRDKGVFLLNLMSSPCCIDGVCSLRYSRGFVPHGKRPLFITPLLWFCYAVEARF